MIETELSKIIDAAGAEAAYDCEAKNLLSEKIILAHILCGTVSEFRDCSPEDVVLLIEGTPQISEISVFPGETVNHKIMGISNEDNVPDEGKVTYDIRFFVLTPDRKSMMKLIIDMEAQKDYYPGYDIVTRGVYYGARMISSQYGTEFENSDYDKIKKVYSIWLCIDSPKYAGDTLTEYSFTQKNIIGNFPKDTLKFDLISVIMVCLSKDPSDTKSGSRLHRLLNVLFTSELSADEKKKIIETEYNIPMTEDLDREVNSMCNLGEGIMEDGIKRGIEQGIKCTIMLLRKENYTDDKIKLLIMEQYNLMEESADEYLHKTEY
ncbi:MAG: hypothetical protein HDT39_16500 [Lachnospiraceae bacterium]|nr:hypothetical protein [Lachnospiraceae bacterium]